MYPNSALPAWQLLVMMVVTVALLVTWIIVVRLADGQPRGCSCPAVNTVIGVSAAEGAQGLRVGEGEGAAAEEHAR